MYQRGLFALVLVAVAAGLLALGAWQWGRGQDKAGAERLLQQRSGLAAVDIAELVALPREQWHGRRVRLRGQALPERWVVLDNRIHRGRAGYEWLLPVQTAAGVALLNYGWFPPGASRDELSPPPDALAGALDVQAQVMIASQPFRLDGQALEPGWPLRAQWLDYAALERRYGEPVLPAQVRLAGSARLAGTGARLAWGSTAMPPERHYAYAVQWFLLALAWCALMLWYRRRHYG